MTSLETTLRGGYIGVVETDVARCVGWLVIDKDGKILHANEKITEVFHYSPADLICKPVGILMDREAAKRHEEWYRQWWDAGRTTRDMSSRMVIYGREHGGGLVRVVITISGTTWYDTPAALAVLLPVVAVEEKE